MEKVKNIIIVVLVLVIVILGYMLMVSFPKKAEAECKANIDTQVIPQLTAAAQAQCAQAIQQCQQTLQQLMLIPACASALPQ